MNNITTSSDLVYADYSDLLDKIIQALQGEQIFKLSNDGGRLLIEVDKIGIKVANSQIQNPLGADSRTARSVTTIISPGSNEKLESQLSKIRFYIQQQAQIISGENSSIEKFISTLVADLDSFQDRTAKLDFSYPFQAYQGLQKQRLTFNEKGSNEQQVLKFHKLAICVQNIHDFNRQLLLGLEKYISVNFLSASATEQEDLDYILEDFSGGKHPDIDHLRKLVDKETLGRLKKQAQINYLEFLLENVDIDSSKSNAEGAIYLEDLIRRLKLIEKYISDSTKTDEYYLVSYEGTDVNYKDMFSRGESYEILPIIPIIDGYLGEEKNEAKGEIEFIFGIKLKFDGKVQALGGKNVFEYHLNLLNPDSAEHKAELANQATKATFIRKVLKIAFLYYFVFASRLNAGDANYSADKELEYNPIEGFEKHAIGILKGTDDAAKQELFRRIYNSFKKLQVKTKVNRLKGLLQRLLKRQTHFPTREYPLHISVKNGILEKNIDNIFKNNTFFKLTLRGNPKENLKYISLGKPHTQSNSLCSLPAKITISDIRFFGTEDRQSFSMEYDLRGIKALPILFVNFKDPHCYKIYNENFLERRLILFTYSKETNNLDSIRAFAHQFTYCLLAYTCLHVLLQKQERLFIPILRLHLHNKEDNAPTEKFLVSLSNVLSHLLNEKHRSNSQGIDIRDFQGKGRFKIPNVMSSLYSVLPKKFNFTNSSYSPQLDKLAIIIVSSRECDRRWNSTDKIANLMGEIIGLRRDKDTVRVQLLTTFSANYDNQQLFTNPSVVVDKVTKLYQENGFRHFVYVAKAPYTSTLHMTQTEDDDGLFFMSRDIVRALKAEHEDIKIYPMYFDKYYAVKLEKIKASSLYIQDTVELTNLVEDATKQSVVFFNLFNGIDIPGEEKNYNGVISYATLLNIYQGILDDEDIRTGLMYDGSLKNDILQYLTLFHFSRYQKASKEIHLKLDPYDNLIGDNSVGKLALLKHMHGRVDFNSLAFLTLVRKIFDVG